MSDEQITVKGLGVGCVRTALGCLVVLLPLALVAYFIFAGIANIGHHSGKACTSSCSNGNNGGGGGGGDDGGDGDGGDGGGGD